MPFGASKSVLQYANIVNTMARIHFEGGEEEAKVDVDEEERGMDLDYDEEDWSIHDCKPACEIIPNDLSGRTETSEIDDMDAEPEAAGRFGVTGVILILMVVFLAVLVFVLIMMRVGQWTSDDVL